MLKDYSKEIFLNFDETKIMRVLLKLVYFIEENEFDFDSKHFYKLEKYHSYLDELDKGNLIKLNKEFQKINKDQKQFQIYITFLERLLHTTSKEYNFIVNKYDSVNKERVKLPLICVIDGVRSLHNIGAIIRSCECFGVNKIYIHDPLENMTPNTFSKTAMGCEKIMEIEFFKNALDILAKYNSLAYELVSLETVKGATSLNDYKPKGGVILVVGHEQFGVDERILKLSDKLISINLLGNKNSLNVAIACSIALQNLSHKLL